MVNLKLLGDPGSKEKLAYMEDCKNRDVIKNQKRIVNLFAWQTCLNCMYYRENTCSLFKSIPPAEVIVFGCEKWELDIPF